MDLELRLMGRANGKTAMMEREVREHPRCLDDEDRWAQMERNADDWDRQTHDDD